MEGKEKGVSSMKKWIVEVSEHPMELVVEPYEIEAETEDSAKKIVKDMHVGYIAGVYDADEWEELYS